MFHRHSAIVGQFSASVGAGNRNLRISVKISCFRSFSDPHQISNHQFRRGFPEFSQSRFVFRYFVRFSDPGFAKISRLFIVLTGFCVILEDQISGFWFGFREKQQQPIMGHLPDRHIVVFFLVVPQSMYLHFLFKHHQICYNIEYRGRGVYHHWLRRLEPTCWLDHVDCHLSGFSSVAFQLLAVSPQQKTNIREDLFCL